MIDKFNDDAIRTLSMAQQEASNLGLYRVDIDEILLGVLSARSGIAAEALEARGVTLGEVREIVNASSSRKRRNIPPAEIELARGVHKVFEVAWIIAQQLGQKFITPDHLLMALIKESRGRAFQVLKSFEIDQSELYDYMIRSVRGLSEQSDTAFRIRRIVFREVFLSEIDQIVGQQGGIGGDDLRRVASIICKVLGASRCAIITRHDENANWKCYEGQSKDLKSCAEVNWPDAISRLVARTLMVETPFIQLESGASVPQLQELRLLGAKSLLAAAILTTPKFQGCLILQQSEYQRRWAPDEVAWINNVAEKIASAFQLGQI
jgi:Clp amino terminal domain, pathogenicity island component